MTDWGWLTPVYNFGAYIGGAVSGAGAQAGAAISPYIPQPQQPAPAPAPAPAPTPTTGGGGGSRTIQGIQDTVSNLSGYINNNPVYQRTPEVQVQPVQSVAAVRSTAWDTPAFTKMNEFLTPFQKAQQAQLGSMTTGYEIKPGTYMGADYGKAGQNNYNTPATQQMIVERLSGIGALQAQGKITPGQASFGVSEMSRQYGYTGESLQGVVNYGAAKQQFLDQPRSLSEFGLTDVTRSRASPVDYAPAPKMSITEFNAALTILQQPAPPTIQQQVSSTPRGDIGITNFVPGGKAGGNIAIENSKMVYGETGGAVGFYQTPKSIYEDSGFTRKYGWISSSGGPGALQSGQFGPVPLAANVYTQESGGTKLDPKYSNMAVAALIEKNPTAYPRMGAEAYGGVRFEPMDGRTLAEGQAMSRYATPNYANLVNPVGVNEPKQNWEQVPWAITYQGAPNIQRIDLEGRLTGITPAPTKTEVTPLDAPTMGLPSPFKSKDMGTSTVQTLTPNNQDPLGLIIERGLQGRLPGVGELWASTPIARVAANWNWQPSSIEQANVTVSNALKKQTGTEALLNMAGFIPMANLEIKGGTVTKEILETAITKEGGLLKFVTSEQGVPVEMRRAIGTAKELGYNIIPTRPETKGIFNKVVSWGAYVTKSKEPKIMETVISKTPTTIKTLPETVGKNIGGKFGVYSTNEELLLGELKVPKDFVSKLDMYRGTKADYVSQTFKYFDVIRGETSDIVGVRTISKLVGGREERVIFAQEFPKGIFTGESSQLSGIFKTAKSTIESQGLKGGLQYERTGIKTLGDIATISPQASLLLGGGVLGGGAITYSAMQNNSQLPFNLTEIKAGTSSEYKAMQITPAPMGVYDAGQAGMPVPFRSRDVGVVGGATPTTGISLGLIPSVSAAEPSGGIIITGGPSAYYPEKTPSYFEDISNWFKSAPILGTIYGAGAGVPQNTINQVQTIVQNTPILESIYKGGNVFELKTDYENLSAITEKRIAPQLSEYNTGLTDYNKNLGKYNAGVTGYSGNLTRYNSDLANYNSSLNIFNTHLATYNAGKTEGGYNALVGEEAALRSQKASLDARMPVSEYAALQVKGSALEAQKNILDTQKAAIDKQLAPVVSAKTSYETAAGNLMGNQNQKEFITYGSGTYLGDLATGYQSTIETPLQNIIGVNPVSQFVSGFVSVPRQVLTIGQSGLIGGEGIIRNAPQFPGIATAGTAMMLKGTYEQAMTNPAGLVGTLAGMYVLSAGVSAVGNRAIGLYRTGNMEYVPIENIGYGPEGRYPLNPVQSESALARSFAEGKLYPAPTRMAEPIGGSTRVPYLHGEGGVPVARLPNAVAGDTTLWTALESSSRSRSVGVGEAYRLETSGGSEVQGLYAAPIAESYFAKVGGIIPKMVGFDFPFKTPTIYSTVTEGLEGIPRAIRDTARSGDYTLVNEYVQARSTAVPAGQGYMPLLKGEYEAIIPDNTIIEVTGRNYYTKLGGFGESHFLGTRVPIVEQYSMGFVPSGVTPPIRTINPGSSYAPPPSINLVYGMSSGIISAANPSILSVSSTTQPESSIGGSSKTSPITSVAYSPSRISSLSPVESYLPRPSTNPSSISSSRVSIGYTAPYSESGISPGSSSIISSLVSSYKPSYTSPYSPKYTPPYSPTSPPSYTPPYSPRYSSPYSPISPPSYTPPYSPKYTPPYSPIPPVPIIPLLPLLPNFQGINDKRLPKKKRKASFIERFGWGLDLSIGRPKKTRAKSFKSPKYPKRRK